MGPIIILGAVAAMVAILKLVEICVNRNAIYFFQGWELQNGEMPFKLSVNEDFNLSDRNAKRLAKKILLTLEYIRSQKCKKWYISLPYEVRFDEKILGETDFQKWFADYIATVRKKKLETEYQRKLRKKIISF